MSGAKALVKALEREKVEVIFGIPGGATIPFYDELYDSSIRHILVRHEQVAAHAADGYARASGNIGVCCATSGPGATNLTTGIANAYMDSVPIVALTGQVPTAMIGKDAFQEADTVGITMPITKHNFQLRSVEEIPTVIKMAFKIAKTGRPGPVLIDIPKDVQEREGEVTFPKDVVIPGYKPTIKGNINQIKRAAKLIVNAERPIIMAGGGVILSNASQELKTLAEMFFIPVVTTLMGKGCFPETHPLALGCIGMHGRKVANYAINDSDLIIAVGCRFSDRSTGAVSLFAPEAKIIHIDIDPAEIGKNVRADLPIVGDAKSVLTDLISCLKGIRKEKTEWAKKVEKFKKEFAPFMDYDQVPMHPARVMKEITKVLSSDDIITTEVGQCQMWASHFLPREKPRTFLSSGGLGTMGFGFPAALGAKVAKPETNVIDIAGDGSFLMVCQDLATAVEEKIPVVVAVLDNRYLGMVRQWQELFFDRRYSSTFLGEIPDFVKLAEAFDARGIRVTKPEEVAPAVKEGFESDKVTVLDIIVDKEANILPMVPPGRGLKEIIE
ncbi:MAG: acetolactate synthase large subunit [Candidatus Hydrothermarchaeota archaeon]|nr:MAG: acetolactate synthase large subunit [Candidatus Hydrothermarchaeota archaeon]